MSSSCVCHLMNVLFSISKYVVVGVLGKNAFVVTQDKVDLNFEKKFLCSVAVNIYEMVLK